jgi:hypothetical protein
MAHCAHIEDNIAEYQVWGQVNTFLLQRNAFTTLPSGISFQQMPSSVLVDGKIPLGINVRDVPREHEHPNWGRVKHHSSTIWIW